MEICRYTKVNTVQNSTSEIIANKAPCSASVLKITLKEAGFNRSYLLMDVDVFTETTSTHSVCLECKQMGVSTKNFITEKKGWAIKLRLSCCVNGVKIFLHLKKLFYRSKLVKIALTLIQDARWHFVHYYKM